MQTGLMIPAQMKPAQQTESGAAHGRGDDMHCELGGGWACWVKGQRCEGSRALDEDADAADGAGCGTSPALALDSSARASIGSWAMQNNEFHATHRIHRRENGMAIRSDTSETRAA